MKDIYFLSSVDSNCTYKHNHVCIYDLKAEANLFKGKKMQIGGQKGKEKIGRNMTKIQN